MIRIFLNNFCFFNFISYIIFVYTQLYKSFLNNFLFLIGIIFVNFCLKWQKTKLLVHTTMARPLCTMMDPSCRKSWDCSWFVYIQPNLEAGENNGHSPRILLTPDQEHIYSYLEVQDLNHCAYVIDDTHPTRIYPALWFLVR